MVAAAAPDSAPLLAVIGASPAGRRSLEHVIAIALGLGAPVRLVVADGAGRAIEGVAWTAERVAAWGAERLGRAGLAVELHVVRGPAAEVIAKLASGAALVVVGQDGDGDRLPDRLIRSVRAPVLVVRDGPGQATRTYRVLLAVRDSRDVAPDVAAVARLAAAVEVEALVVHVPEIGASPFAGYLEAEAEAAVWMSVKQLSELGVKVEARMLPPSLEPAIALCWLAEEWDATLVVLNSSRPSGFLGWLAPSTARAMLRHGSRPILLTAR